MDQTKILVLLPYVCVAAVLLLLSVLRAWEVFDEGIDRTLGFLLILAAAVVAGMVDLGTDAPGYRDFYDQLHSTGAGESHTWWEPGFLWLATVFYRLGAPYGLLAFCSVLISQAVKLYVIDKIVSNRMFALFVLYCFNLGEVAFVREYVSASLVLLSFYLMAERRFVPAVLATVVAMLFHKTALIVAPIFVVAHFGRASFKPMLVALLLAGLVFAVIPSEFLTPIEARVFTQLAAYTMDDFVQGAESDAKLAQIRNFLKFAIYIGLSVWMLRQPARTPQEKIQRSAGRFVILLSVASVILESTVSTIFARLAMYIYPFLAIAARAERFSPNVVRLPAQTIAAGMFVANMIITIYPWTDYF